MDGIAGCYADEGITLYSMNQELFLSPGQLTRLLPCATDNSYTRAWAIKSRANPSCLPADSLAQFFVASPICLTAACRNGC